MVKWLYFTDLLLLFFICHNLTAQLRRKFMYSDPMTGCRRSMEEPTPPRKTCTPRHPSAWLAPAAGWRDIRGCSANQTPFCDDAMHIFRPNTVLSVPAGGCSRYPLWKMEFQVLACKATQDANEKVNDLCFTGSDRGLRNAGKIWRFRLFYDP